MKRKNKPKITGIYQIVNTQNGKRYVGSSKDIYNRWNDHFRCLKNNKHGNKHLQLSWNNYTKNNFQFLILEECSIESLQEREQYWMDYFQSYNSEFGYNISKDTKVFGRDIKYPPEIIKKRSESNKIKFNEEEIKDICGIYLDGKTLNIIGEKYEVSATVIYRILIENNIKIRKKGEILIGRKLTDQHKLNVSLHHADQSGEKSGMFGKPAWNKGLTKHTDERVRKAGENNIGKRKDVVWIKNDNENKLIKIEEIDEYLKDEKWVLGLNNKSEYTRKLLSEINIGKIYITKDEITTSIKPEKLEEYLKNGWKLGRNSTFSKNMLGKFKGEKSGSYIKIDKNIQKQICEDYLSCLFMLKDISKKYDCSIYIIKRILKDNNIEIRNRSEAQKVIRKLK